MTRIFQDPIVLLSLTPAIPPPPPLPLPPRDFSPVIRGEAGFASPSPMKSGKYPAARISP